MTHPAPLLTWSDDYLVGETAMDACHREFVTVVQALASAADTALPQQLDEFIAHAQIHFGDEDGSMAQTGFPAAACHAAEHAAVLQSAAEVRAALRQGRTDVARAFAAELARWFPSHVIHLDSALSHWLVGRRHQAKPVVLRRPSKPALP